LTKIVKLSVAGPIGILFHESGPTITNGSFTTPGIFITLPLLLTSVEVEKSYSIENQF
jgi:hypothetical protein